MKRSTMLQRQTNLLGALEAVIGEPVPRSVAKTGPVLSVIASAFRREQGIGVMRERRRQKNTPFGFDVAIVPDVPEGAMVLVPVEFNRSRKHDHSFRCDKIHNHSPVIVDDDEYVACQASCPVASAWLDELQKRGSK